MATVTIEVMIHRGFNSESRAYLMSDDGDQDMAKWVPKSQVRKMEPIDEDQSIFAVTLPEWLANREGWT